MIQRPFLGLRRTFSSLFFLDLSASRNPAMEGLRAWAVMLVFLVHGIGSYMFAAHQVGFDKYLPDFVPTITELSIVDKVLLMLHRSHSGVDLFFLLSGFLICRTAIRIDSVQGFGRFMGRRWLRIYPAFIVSLIFCVILAVKILRGRPFVLGTFVGDALMLFGCPYLPLSSYNDVTWSLFWEMAFYALFPLQIALARRALSADDPAKLPAATGLLALSCLFMAFQPRVVMFYFGVMLALVSEEQLRAYAARLNTVLVVALYLAIDMIYRLMPISYGWYMPLYGVAASLLFVKICFGQGWLTRLFSATPLRWLGNISYSFYLMHTACIAIAWRIGQHTGWPSNSLLALACFLCLSLALSLVSSALLFLICERWYFIRMHKKPAAPKEQLPLAA
jgi:exopolysaccharide production protein ExoZ